MFASTSASSVRILPRSRKLSTVSSSRSRSLPQPVLATSAPQQPPPPQDDDPTKRLRHGAAALLAAAAVSTSVAVSSPALAIDAAAVGSCLLQNCQLELARCLLDEKCEESLICLNKCNGRPDESDCQIKCGDLYADKAIAAFNSCAVSQKKCVPQKEDDFTYPIPPQEAQVKQFSPSFFDPKQNLQGRWYITNGYNKLFDIFDCQEHFFSTPKPDDSFYGKFDLAIKINWRVKKTNGQFYERSDVQTFVQDPNNPAFLYNHDNEFLHYQDDWYIISAKEDDYAFVYYRGKNDAWDGYGGAVVYSRTPTLRPENIPALEKAAASVGLKWEDFVATDNTCGPEPPLKVVRPTDLDVLADDIIAVEKGFVKEVLVEEKLIAKEVKELEEEALVSFSRGFTVLQKEFSGEVKVLEEDLQELQKLEKRFEQVEQRYASSISERILNFFRTFTGFGKN